MFDLDAIVEHCIAKTDARVDLDRRALWTNYLVRQDDDFRH
jgi:hypothetical protein